MKFLYQSLPSEKNTVGYLRNNPSRVLLSLKDFGILDIFIIFNVMVQLELLVDVLIVCHLFYGPFWSTTKVNWHIITTHAHTVNVILIAKYKKKNKDFVYSHLFICHIWLSYLRNGRIDCDCVMYNYYVKQLTAVRISSRRLRYVSNVCN